ncbi:PAS domain S-box protein, partial [Pelobium sp.]
LTALASTICATPISLVSLLDDHRQWFKSKVGLAIDETPRELAFCKYAILDQELMEVEDATIDERFKNNPLVTLDPQIKFYAGQPLVDKQGNALGTICVIDKVPRKLNDMQREALRLIGQFVVELIEERRKHQELKYFDKLFNLSNDLICIAGTDGYFKKVNPAVEELLGFDEKYIISNSFYDLIHPDDIEKTQAEVEQLAKGLPTINFINRWKCKNGEYKYLQWVASPEVSTGYLFCIARDLTLEKQKEKLLLDSERKLRAFFENSHGFMCTHDLKGNFITVNSAGAKTLGYTQDEVIKMSLFDAMPKTHHDELQKYLEVIAEKGVARGIMHTLHKDGRVLIWLFSNVLETDLEGNSYVIGNAIDITERHQLEQDLKHTKEMLERTNEVARIGTWNLDIATSKIFWSDVTKAIHGVDLNYQPIMDTALSFYEGEDKAAIAQVVEKAIKNGTSYDVELKIKTIQGKPIWVRAIGTPEFKDGVCHRLYGTFQDINERKETEIALLSEKSRLRAFVDHAPASVAMFDAEMRYIAVSQKWLQDYDLKDRNIIGLSHYEVFPHIGDEWKAIYNKCLNGAVEKNDEYLRASTKTPQYLSWEIRPWYQFDQSIGGIMIFTQDITESVNYREELKKAKVLAEEANLAKSEFLANMSHEIRTPLNGVIGFTDLVLKTNLNSTQQQYLSIVHQSANSLLVIINDILDFSKIEAGKLELDINKNDLFEISSQAIDMISYQVQNKGLELLLNISVDLPRFIWTDALRLKQVLINLLGNAVKFTVKGEIELKIFALGVLSSNEIELRFEVRDTGIGIQSDKLNKIFEAFEQEDASTTKKYGGTGLGLTISNKLLGLMGSKLQLNSELGKGSTFFFDLKFKVEHGHPIDWERLDQINRVLIVDNNENNRHILRQMLLLKNIIVEEANDGLEAIQLLSKSEKSFDAVLMDYHMPIMDGLETIKKIRGHLYKTAKELPIILLHSSADDAQILTTCEALEVTQHLNKPIKMHELYQTLQQIHHSEEKISAINQVQNQLSIQNQEIKILVVEDNVINKLLMKTILERLTPYAQIIEANDGAEAVKLFEALQPDLVFMDIQMPVMNGYEATEKIRALSAGKETPIVALTAASVKGEKEKCLAIGMNDFLTKPFVEEAIAVVFDKWLNQKTDVKPKEVQVSEQKTNVHFDVEVPRNFVAQDADALSYILQMVLSTLNGMPASIKQLIKEQKLNEIKAVGHKLFGTASSTGLGQLAVIARKLEYVEDFNEEVLSKLSQELEQEIVIVCELINDFLKE